MEYFSSFLRIHTEKKVFQWADFLTSHSAFECATHKNIIFILFVYHAATLQANADRQQQKTVPPKIKMKDLNCCTKSNENIDRNLRGAFL